MFVKSLPIKPWEQSLNGMLWAAEDQFPNFSSPGTPTRDIAGADIASAATIAPTRQFHTVTGTTQIDNITIPYPGFAGFLLLRFTGACVISAAGNVAISVTMAANELVLLFYVPSLTKWVGYVQNLVT